MDSAGKHESLGCSHCGKATKMVCKGCKGLPDGSEGQMEVHYCGTECQKKDWASHKTSCSAARARKAIYRAAKLAKAVSHVFLRVKYKMIIQEVKKLDYMWILCPPSEYKGGKCLLQPFPTALFPDKEDADAILEFQACNAILDHLHGFLEQLLTGICSEVDEVVHFTQNTRRRLLQAYNTGPPSNQQGIDATDHVHSVLRVTLKNGEKYILDLTGAQYGWQEILTPYNVYQQSKIRLIREVLPFGGTRQFCKGRAENSGGMAQWQHQADIGFENILNHILKVWQQGNLSLTTLLRLPDDQFEKRQDWLLLQLEAGMQHYRKLVVETGALDMNGDIVVGAPDRKFKDLTGKPIN